ncbi:MAG TPA: hypothetical protein VFH88_01405 [Candidatus Krumholzibacteria bacterium]|nr:hypothetical protein [Candidatus Krumholzibacteria bacterium]
MKSISLLVSLLILMGGVIRPAKAQVPYLRIYSSDKYDRSCITCPPLNTLVHLYVVLEGWTEPFSAIDFTIDYGEGLYWAWDDLAYPDGTVTIGYSPTGIAIAWGTCCLPDPSSGETLVLKPVVLGTPWCVPNTPVKVKGYGYGTPAIEKPYPTVVRYPDLTEVSVYGLDSYICPPIAVEPTTWGAVKALYRR